MTIKIKATGQYSPVVQGGFTFKSVDEICKCGHLAVYYTAHGSSSILEAVDAS